MLTDQEDLHPMFQTMLQRTDGWTDSVNESSLDYNFMTRHPTMSIVFLILTSTAALAGNIGNLLVIGAVISYRPLLHNKGSIFVINLAVADLCITTIVSPMNMVGVARGPRFFIDKVQLCNMLGSICTVSCIVSMLSIAAVAVNRLIQICKYFVYHRIFTHKKTIAYCISLWLFAILLDLPNWLGWGGHTFGLKEMGCTFDRIANHSYTIFLALMSIAVPMVIVLASYITIVFYVRHCRLELRQIGSMSKKRLKDEIQFAVTLFVSFLAFVTCWSVYMIAIIFDYRDQWPKEVYVIGTLLGHANSCLNPIIYALASVRFRKGYYMFCHKIFCIPITKDSYINDSRNGSTLKYTSKTKSPVLTPILDRNSRIEEEARMYTNGWKVNR